MPYPNRTGLFFRVKEPSLRLFFAGNPKGYHYSMPNRVWMLFYNFPHRHHRYWCAHKNGHVCDHRDPQTYSMCLRFAIFNIYTDWPIAGKAKMNLLQDYLGTDDLGAWERVTPLEEIVPVLISLDI